MVTRKNITLALTLALAVVIGWGSLGIATTVFAAPTCSGASCDYVDPYGTTCWNDKYTANSDSNGSLLNRNYYSPGCVANFSYTYYPSSSWLAAESWSYSGDAAIYHGSQLYKWVWNVMLNGNYTVCTKGHRGTSYANYNLHTLWSCA